MHEVSSIKMWNYMTYGENLVLFPVCPPSSKFAINYKEKLGLFQRGF